MVVHGSFGRCRALVVAEESVHFCSLLHHTDSTRCCCDDDWESEDLVVACWYVAAGSGSVGKAVVVGVAAFGHTLELAHGHLLGACDSPGAVGELSDDSSLLAGLEHDYNCRNNYGCSFAQW